MILPEIQTIFPKNTRSAIRFFWAMYWVWFFIYLPWMLIRQAAIFAYQFSSILFTWNRDFEFLEGRLRIHFLNSLRSFFVTAVFGERFTAIASPNREVRAQEWIKTLREYLNLPIRTMVGTHGHVFSTDPKVPAKPFLVKRADPLKLIRDKMEFLVWARLVVKQGEERGLSYRVIEACLFPWYRSWSWKNWFTDEGGRLFSAGEFSRTYFLRSLSDTPHLVPARFPLFSRMAK